MRIAAIGAAEISYQPDPCVLASPDHGDAGLVECGGACVVRGHCPAEQPEPSLIASAYDAHGAYVGGGSGAVTLRCSGAGVLSPAGFTCAPYVCPTFDCWGLRSRER